MEIDLKSRDSIYNAIKLAIGDNAKLFATAETIRRQHMAQVNHATNDAKKTAEIPESLAECLDSLDLTSDDAAIRAGARAVLITKLKSGEITAAEFAQFKDVFGLASQGNDIEFTVIEWIPESRADQFADLPPDEQDEIREIIQRRRDSFDASSRANI